MNSEHTYIPDITSAKAKDGISLGLMAFLIFYNIAFLIFAIVAYQKGWVILCMSMSAVLIFGLFLLVAVIKNK